MKNTFFIILLIEILRMAESQNNRTRMIRGETAKRGQFPFVIALLSETLHTICTGSLITWGKVLTAAHCVHDSKVKTCLAGETNGNVLLSNNGELINGQAREVMKFVVHPEAEKSFANTGRTSLPNDLAIITVVGKFQKSQAVALIKLSSDAIKTDDPCIAIGFGRHLRDTDLPDGKLRSGYFQVAEISSWQPKIYYIESENQNVNHGDSGGPLVNHDVSALLGVCYGRSLDYSTSIYVNIVEHRNWITQHIKEKGIYRRAKSIANRFNITAVSNPTLFWLFSIRIFSL